MARLAHVGFHPQRQAGRWYVGVVLPVGRMRVEQMRALADIAERFGSGSIRWTVWQNLIISDIPTENIPEVKRAIEAAGLHWSATNVRAGLVACTGNAGCKYSASNTKRHAMAIADYLEDRVAAGSAAQHPRDRLPPFVRPALHRRHRAAGHQGVRSARTWSRAITSTSAAAYGEQRNIGRELYRDIVADEVPPLVERMLLGYMAHRAAPEESFHDYTRRQPTETLLATFRSRVAGRNVNVMTVPIIPESAPFQFGAARLAERFFRRHI